MLKVALAEMNIIWENKLKNQEICGRFFQAAALYGADLLIFPEMTLTGFTMDTALAEDCPVGGCHLQKSLMADYDTPTQDFFCRLSKEHHMAVLFGMSKKSPAWQKARNVCCLALDGKVCWEYEKIHPFSYGSEAVFYEGGRTLVYSRLKDVVLSPQICYDLRFPEIFQKISDSAHLITVIANWPAARQEQWDALLKARAIETQCYLIGVNRCGSDLQNNYTEHTSAVYDPYGKRIETEYLEKNLLSEDGRLYTAWINPHVAEEYRDTFPVKKDRIKRHDLIEKRFLK